MIKEKKTFKQLKLAPLKRDRLQNNYNKYIQLPR